MDRTSSVRSGIAFVFGADVDEGVKKELTARAARYTTDVQREDLGLAEPASTSERTSRLKGRFVFLVAHGGFDNARKEHMVLTARRIDASNPAGAPELVPTRQVVDWVSGSGADKPEAIFMVACEAGDSVTPVEDGGTEPRPGLENDDHKGDASLTVGENSVPLYIFANSKPSAGASALRPALAAIDMLGKQGGLASPRGAPAVASLDPVRMFAGLIPHSVEGMTLAEQGRARLKLRSPKTSEHLVHQARPGSDPAALRARLAGNSSDVSRVIAEHASVEEGLPDTGELEVDRIATSLSHHRGGKQSAANDGYPPYIENAIRDLQEPGRLQRLMRIANPIISAHELNDTLLATALAKAFPQVAQEWVERTLRQNPPSISGFTKEALRLDPELLDAFLPALASTSATAEEKGCLLSWCGDKERRARGVYAIFTTLRSRDQDEKRLLQLTGEDKSLLRVEIALPRRGQSESDSGTDSVSDAEIDDGSGADVPAKASLGQWLLQYAAEDDDLTRELQRLMDRA